MKIIIPGELPSLNEIIKAAKCHYGSYSSMKKKYTSIVNLSSPKRRIETKVDIYVKWITKNEKKDPDNVAAGIKFILDGLVESGIIVNDTRKYIGKITHEFGIDKENPRIEVDLIELI
jgi:Holliday junction resolvase RusA-like endonuclease